MVSRPAGWLAIWLIPAAAGATPGEPPAALRVWATTRLELAAREVADEAGARWLEVEGRLSSDLGEPIGAAELRFERPGGAERCSTDPTGRCRVRLRSPAGGAPWVARFDGGERLRPSEAPVPTTARPSAGNAWAVFLPLFVLGAAALAVLGVFGARRLGPLWRRLHAALRLRTGRTRGAPGETHPIGSPRAARRLRVLDALRFRPVAGARLVPVATPGTSLATTDADGWAELPPGAARIVAQAPGYVPQPLAPPAAPTDGEPTERLALLRGRDALAVLLEAPVGPDSRPVGSWPESVLRIAGRVFPPAEAERLARLCYRRAGRPEPADRPVVEALVRRAVGAPGEETPAYPTPGEVLDALASEPAVGDETTGPASRATAALRG